MVDQTKLYLAEKVHFDQSQPFGAKSKGSDKLEGSVVPGELGKVHFDSRFSASKGFKPSCRMVPHIERCPDATTHSNRGPQLHTLKFTAYNPYRDRRHLTENDVIGKGSRLATCGKKMVYDEQDNMVSQYRSNEFQLESTIARKQRVNSDDRKRNGIPVAKKGDKVYDTPERSTGYFKDGGLIVGSSMNPRPEKKLKGSKEQSTVHNGKSIRSLTAHERRENELTDTDRQQVEILTKSHFRRGQEQPSWEEKTGMWLCNPEEEED